MRSSSAAVGCSVMKPSQNLLSWQVFVATCRTRSISQAAVLLDIDLPKASRLLSALETELGEPLFDKSHRPIQPTPRAAELQRAVEPLVAGFQAALNLRRSRMNALLFVLQHQLNSHRNTFQTSFSNIRSFSMILNSQCSRRSGRTTFVAGM